VQYSSLAKIPDDYRLDGAYKISKNALRSTQRTCQETRKPLLAAIHLLRSPHVIMPHPCMTVEEWTARYAPASEP
jgi:hypothetical protein